MTKTPTSDREFRSLERPVETRSEDGGSMAVAGYAAVFNQEARIGDWFREVIAPGAFRSSLDGRDVRAFFDHDPGRILGRSSSGTLRLREDDKGLAVEIDLPDTTDGRDVRALIERGDVSGMSFGFAVTRQEWDETGEIPLRTIRDLDLVEVSIVSMPAYGGTSIALRSLDAARGHEKTRNFNAAQRRLRMKLNLDLRVRSKA